MLNPIALRKAKIVYNFGLSGCNRVKKKEFAPKFFPLRAECIFEGLHIKRS